MALNKRLLAAGIIALAGAIGLSGLDRNENEPVLDVKTEIALAKPGDEIKALRTENTKSFKLNPAQIQTRVYTKSIHYYDSEKKSFEKQDLSTREISALAKLNPFRKYDKYIDAGNYQVTWKDEKEDDYTFNYGDDYISYEALFDKKEIAVEQTAKSDGIKTEYILANWDAPTVFKWIIKATGKMDLQPDGSVEILGTKLVINAPIAWDSKHKDVSVFVKISGDTLIYGIDIIDAVYPIVLDPSTSINIGSKSGHYRTGDTNVTYLNARNTATKAARLNEITSHYRVGTQYYSANFGYQSRSYLSFPMPSMSAVITCSLYVNGYDNYNSDSLVVVSASEIKTTIGDNPGWFSKFSGWASTGVYTGKILNSNIAYTYSTGEMGFEFNAVGRDSVKAASGDTLWLALLSYRDYQNTIIATNNYSSFDSQNDIPYLSYTYSVGATEDILASADSSATVYHNHPSTYLGARDTTTAGGNNSLAAATPLVGQYKSGSTYVIERTQLQFYIPVTDTTDSITFAELWYKNASDSSTTDFNIFGVYSTKSGAVSNAWYSLFTGWGASGAYIPVYLTEGQGTADFVTGWSKSAFTVAGIDTIRAHEGSYLQIAMLSSRDISSTAPTGMEYVTLANGTDRPFIRLYKTPMVPQNVTVTAADTDSITITWDDVTGDETGFRIIDDDTETAVDSTAANAESKGIAGLSVNTLYHYKIQVKGGVLDGEYSAPDMAYTFANTPGVPTISFPADSLLKFIIAENSNPAITRFAVQDSITGEFVQSIAGLDTFGTAAFWGTKAEWGGANGDTVKIKSGKKYVIRAKAKSGSD